MRSRIIIRERIRMRISIISIPGLSSRVRISRDVRIRIIRIIRIRSHQTPRFSPIISLRGRIRLVYNICIRLLGSDIVRVVIGLIVRHVIHISRACRRMRITTTNTYYCYYIHYVS